MKKLLVLFVLLIAFSIPIIAQDGSGIEIGSILSVVFGLLMTVFGGIAAWLKSKSNKLANFSQQSIEAAMAGNDLVQYHKLAIADDKLTKAELDGYVEKAKAVGKETEEAVQAFKDLFKKGPDKK